MDTSNDKLSRNISSESHEKPTKLGQYQCIGPCYPPNTTILHPITLQLIDNTNYSFCPINPWKDKLNRIHNVTVCSKPTVDIEYKDIEQDYILPELAFDPAEFLIINYNIRSLEEAVLWYNKHLTIPYKTIKRIMDCALLAHGLEELKISSDYMIDFTKYMIMEHWFDDYYKLLTTDKNKSIIKKQINDILTSLLLTRILTKYAQNYKNTWNTITSHLNKLKRVAFIFIRNKLLKNMIEQ